MKTTFISAISSIEEKQTGNANNPLLTIIKFIFSDNQANDNKQGVDEEEFESISKSAINMPVKMRLTEDNIGGHELSVPIGHITDMEIQEEGDIKKLVASAVLYKNEFPQEVKFLKEAFDGGEAPGISWELAFQDSAIKDGIEWLKKVITAAATFVKSPAYGKRTALLAIASSAVASSDEEAIEQVRKIVELWDHKNPTQKGGMTMDELEKAKSELAEALKKITALETDLTTANTGLETANTKITELETENTGLKRTALSEVRTRKYTEAGFTLDTDDEKKTKKLERWLSMSDEQFDEYIAELVEAKATAKSAAASKKGDGLPKLGGEGLEVISRTDLMQGLRKAARGEQ